MTADVDFEVDTDESDGATIDGRMRDEEIERRFPELEMIQDEDLRRDVTSVLGRMVPDYFWTVPATSSSKFHNPFSRGKRGLWIHVKMVFTVYERLVRSLVEQDRLTEYEADCGRAAVLLHDAIKYGHSYSDGDSTMNSHDKMSAAWIRQNTNLPQQIADAVERHNGPWYEGPPPNDDLSDIVHYCDMVASSRDITPGVYEPAEEIAERYPNLPRAEL